MGKKPNQAGNRTMLKAVLCGAASGLLVSIAGAAVTAWMILSGKIGQNRTEIAAWVILFLASFVGSLIASRLTEGKKLQTALIEWGTFFVLLILITALLFGARYKGVWIGIIVTVIPSLAVVMLGLKNRSVGKKKQWKKPYR